MRFWPLLVPFVFGLFVVVFTVGSVAHAQNGTELEGALLGLVLGGTLYSVFAFVATTILLMLLVRRSPVSYPGYAVMLFLSTLPVAYFQAVNAQSAFFMELAWRRLVQAPAPSAEVGMNIVTYGFIFALWSLLTYLPVRKRATSG